MTITYSIQNVTSGLVHTVMMRKFFQMVFIGKDKKSLHIYTATVLGAKKEKMITGQEASYKNGGEESGENGNLFVSELGKVKPFRMKFEFAVGSSDDNDVLDIKNEDLTSNGKHSFLDEVECICNVWGSKCEVIENDQKKLLKRYKEICPEGSVADPTESTAQLSRHKVLWTEQKKNGSDERDFRSLSIAGEVENVDSMQKQQERDEIAMRKAYTISVPKDISLPDGIELVNWVRTTIQFKYVFDDTDHNYIIKKDMGDDAGSCTFLAPDFTWYYSPVMKSYIDNRNCIVEVKRGGRGTYESCLCPVQKNRKIFYRNDKFQNGINQVPNKMTVNFHYWKEEEKINYRQKYRLAVRDIFPKPYDFDDISEISIFLDTSDEHNRGNRQFVAGIFLSLALAYGIDSTRVGEVEYCFKPLTWIMTADICWIAFLVLFSFTWMYKPVKLSEKSRKMLKIRGWILRLSMLWVGGVFGILRSPILLGLESIAKYKECLGWVSGILLIILGIAHICYLNSKNVKIGGKGVLADLFGEDIL